MRRNGYYTPNETVLLTGAGFTKTFGGYLGNEMWAAMLNRLEINRDPILRERLLDQSNFELFYHEVRNSGHYCDEQKKCVNAALVKAFEEMDSVISDSFRDDVNVGFAACKNLISRFAGSKDKRRRGFFFTLNQDLFVERFYRAARTSPKICIPGLECDWWFEGNAHRGFSKEDYLTVPDADETEKVKKQLSSGDEVFLYVKLHGSYGWKAHGGSDTMVIGYKKEGMIKGEPLLEWYLSLFEEILNHEAVKNLLVIGYGFLDKHINGLIADAIDGGLRLHVVSPQTSQSFRDHLNSLPVSGTEFRAVGNRLWGGLYGYYTGTVTDFFSTRNWHPTRLGETLFRNLGIG